jgi:hypothetical protein
MANTPIDAEARGRVRHWKAEAIKSYNRLQEVARRDDTLDLATELAAKTSIVGRRRAFQKIQARFARHAVLEGVRLMGPHPIAAWLVLEPREAVIVEADHPGLAQDCVVTNYLLAGKLPDNDRLAGGLWTLEVPDHALGRIVQRHRAADIGNVLAAAHHAALRLRSQTAMRSLYEDKSFLLPAGAGVFVCKMTAGRNVVDGGANVHVRAATWLHHDQLTTTNYMNSRKP